MTTADTAPAENAPDNTTADDGTQMPPVYPDSTVGILLRQRDDLQRSIEADRVTIGIITARADESAARVKQLDQSIAELSK